ncbi:ATP-binding protein [Streptomyces caniscabiei]|uniref:ATP-binding protein n=1 Tax=Streptomyces caniscabiei TaxID=2746961 RepID=UPI0029AE7887|nr:ATP-binding protein [Streptomyces caniscabiei]MDX2606213.1 ATP-binding protein [Streptomyces caniscabiei]MDX2741487.1 ATP-binding protein [Streptomyces caniscabiei]MDX2776833.1 ATP-binding protein [Streptomyces caniscabiei]
MRKAKFEQQATLEGFDFNASPKQPAAQLRDLAAPRRLHSGEPVTLFGPVGVGRTHVARALGHLAIRQGAGIRFTRTSRILAGLAGSHADRTSGRRPLRTGQRATGPVPEPATGPPAAGIPSFPTPSSPKSQLDRLIHASHQIIMNGPSYRPNKRPKNPTDKPGTASKG